MSSSQTLYLFFTILFCNMISRCVQAGKVLYFLEMNSVVMCWVTRFTSETVRLGACRGGTVSLWSWWTRSICSIPGHFSCQIWEWSSTNYSKKHRRFMMRNRPGALRGPSGWLIQVWASHLGTSDTREVSTDRQDPWWNWLMTKLCLNFCMCLLHGF